MTNDVNGAGRALQHWNAEGYAKNARFVAELGLPLLDLLAAQRGERVLDVGCGDGAFTASIAEAGAVVVGIDSSSQLVAAARERGLDARLMDAQNITVAGPFDAVVSNAALHWMLEPDVVVAGVKRVLRPGGRFVGEFGGHGNVAAIRTALAAVLGARGVAVAQPWYFPTTDEYASVLQRHGFGVQVLSLVARPTPLPTGLDGWLTTFANPFIGHLEPALRAEIVAAVLALLEPILKDTAGRWTADYVRLRFAAVSDESSNEP